MYISKAIISNIGNEVVKQFIKSKNISEAEIREAGNMENLLAELIDVRRINIDDVEEFFYNQLMFGKRRHIRIYNLNDCKKILFEEDWLKFLKNEFGIESLNFNTIRVSIPSNIEPRKIVAIHTECNEKGEIVNIEILFAVYIVMKDTGDSCCYIPVQFDLKKKLLIVKAWQRQGIKDEEQYKQSFIMDEIFNLLEEHLTFTIEDRTEEYKEILYRMNQGLVEELFAIIPAYKEVKRLDNDIENFSDIVLNKINLENKKSIRNEIVLPAGVMDLKDELFKLIQRLVVSDYFMTRDYSEVWKMGVHGIVTKVKFNTIENVIAVVSGEDTKSPVFCSKAFLSLLKYMEEVKTVNVIWIAFKYSGRIIKVKYDASNIKYLEIRNLSGNKIFDKYEFQAIWEELENYESVDNRKIEEFDNAAIS